VRLGSRSGKRPRWWSYGVYSASDRQASPTRRYRRDRRRRRVHRRVGAVTNDDEITGANGVQIDGTGVSSTPSRSRPRRTGSASRRRLDDERDRRRHQGHVDGVIISGRRHGHRLGRHRRELGTAWISATAERDAHHERLDRGAAPMASIRRRDRRRSATTARSRERTRRRLHRGGGAVTNDDRISARTASRSTAAAM